MFYAVVKAQVEITPYDGEVIFTNSEGHCFTGKVFLADFVNLVGCPEFSLGMSLS